MNEETKDHVHFYHLLYPVLLLFRVNMQDILTMDEMTEKIGDISDG